MSRAYVPAAGHDWLLPLYDPLQKILGGDAAREELIEAAAIGRGHRVLDVGCGTGSLVARLSRLHADAEIVGLDPDPKALARAREKLAGASVMLDEGFSDQLPYEAASFDRVFSTFMFHHLGPDVKKGTLAEIARVLRPGGELHLLDFSTADDHSSGFLARLLHSHDHLHDNSARRITEMLEQAGFVGAREVANRKTLFGRVGRFCGQIPAAA